MPSPYDPPIHYAPLADTPRPPRRFGTLVLGALVGLLIGGGGVALGWVLGTGQPPTGPAAEAQAACQAIHGANPALHASPAEARRWSGATDLALAAAETDTRYEPLGNALSTVEHALTTQDPVQADKGAGQAQTFCTAN